MGKRGMKSGRAQLYTAFGHEFKGRLKHLEHDKKHGRRGIHGAMEVKQGKKARSKKA